MEYVIKVYAYDLSPKELDDLFDRVLEAAHAKDEQVFCVGTTPTDMEED